MDMEEDWDEVNMKVEKYYTDGYEKRIKEERKNRVRKEKIEKEEIKHDSELYVTVRKAIKAKETGKILNAVGKFKNIQKADNGAICLLEYAVRSGSKEIVRALVEAGARAPPGGLVDAAAKYGDVKLMKYIVDKTCEGVSNGTDVQRSDLTGPLCTAIMNNQMAAFNFLLSHGANVDGFYMGQSPLHRAAEAGRSDYCKLLLEKGANVNVKNDHAWTPLHVAAQKGRLNNATLLVEADADIGVQDSTGNTALDTACRAGQAEIARLLFVNGAQVAGHKEDYLLRAIKERRAGIVHVLLNFASYNPNSLYTIKNQFHLPALHVAVSNCPHSMSIRWQFLDSDINISRELEMYDTLIHAGADINLRNGSAQTPLHVCVTEGCLATLQYFIDKGADCTTVNNDQETPLLTAILRHIKVAAERLIAECPDLVNHRNNGTVAQSPLLTTVYKNQTDILKLLIEADYSMSKEEKDKVSDWMATRQLGDAPFPGPGGRGRGQGRGRGRGRGGQAPISRPLHPIVENLLDVHLSHAMSLQHLARSVVRTCLRSQVSRKVQRLEIPSALRDYICLKKKRPDQH